MMIDSDNWYFHEEGIALGPFSGQEMASRFKQNPLPADSLLWNPAQDKWRPLSEIQPAWTQVSSTSPMVQPGPLRIPMSAHPTTLNTSGSENAPAARPAPKPLARSAQESATTSKPSFFKRLFGRKT